MRTAHLPQRLLGEPAWDMLLFLVGDGDGELATKTLCAASGVPTTTALRHLQSLEQVGLVARARGSSDQRVTTVRLTEKGARAMAAALRPMAVWAC